MPGVAIYRRLPHLWRNANGYLYIVWSDRGRWRRQATKTTKLAAAQEALRAFVEQGGAGAAPAKRQTLAEAAAEWFAERSSSLYGLSIATIREYRVSVERLQDAPLGRFQADEVLPRDVKEFLRRLAQQGASAGTQVRTLAHLRTIYRWLQRQERVRANPAELVETPRVQRGRRPAIRPEQFESLHAAAVAELEAAAGDSERREAQLLVDLLEVLWRSGLRSIEAIRLRWEDVDLEERTWRIRSPANKGGDQVMPLHPELVPVLRRRRLETAAEAGPFAVEWHVRNAWRRFKARHKDWAGWSLHSLRHGFVTRVRAAAGDAAAGHLARHKSKSMTEHYTHFDAETFREVLQDL